MDKGNCRYIFGQHSSIHKHFYWLVCVSIASLIVGDASSGKERKNNDSLFTIPSSLIFTCVESPWKFSFPTFLKGRIKLPCKQETVSSKPVACGVLLMFLLGRKWL